MYLPLRPSESDRRRAIGVLKKGYVAGRLSTETFEERVAAAHTARSREALRALMADVSGRWLAANTLLRAGGRAEARATAPWASLMLSRCDRVALLVGRARSCDLVFGGPSVSRRHARFELVGDEWHVTDLDSMNGTYVDDVRVDRAPVATGSRVLLGDSVLDIA